MPQVDLETLLVCGDRKIVCETLIDGEGDGEATEDHKPIPPPDFPADSFRLPTLKDEIDWVERNAFYERKNSTKASTVPNSGNLSSQRHTHKSKASVIGLPKRPDCRQLCQASRRNSRPPSTRFFPKPAGKPPSSVPEAEPGSPKVSCIGRVRPKEKAQPRLSKASSLRRRHPGFWGKFMRLLGQRRKHPTQSEEKPPAAPDMFQIPSKGEKVVPTVEYHIPALVPPSLGGMNKLASGRRPPSWGGEDDVDIDVVDVHVEGTDSKYSHTVWSRRGTVGSPVDCGREWECVGPATV